MTVIPQKRKKGASVLKQSTFDHPFGIKPLGNSYFDSANGIKECKSLGLSIFSILPEQQLLELLIYLGPEVVSRLAQTSRAFYVYCYHDDIWRQFAIKRFNGEFEFKVNWRNTFKSKYSNYIQDSPIKINGFYSDLLYTAWRCVSVPLKDLCGIEKDNIDRRSNMTLEAFIEEYMIPNRPVILTDVVQNWPAYKKWDFEYLLTTDFKYRAEAVDITFTNYHKYMTQCKEEAPLYLFDKKCTFDDTMKNDFTIPEYFNQDLFSVLKEKRPDFRWLIVGPERSGSTFHIDPNSTNAWNAVIKGSKKWILYPPNHIPPGVYPSKDGSEVTSPVSLAEWFLNYYQNIQDDPIELQPIEAVCKEGEILFVPNKWWHCVMNLEPGIALTQNFVGMENLENVLNFCKKKPEQVSGFCHGDLYDEFKKGLLEDMPEVWEKVKHLDQAGAKEVWSNLCMEKSFSFTF
ncbi:hypothetical protein HDV06_006356 [Boothiomyces sp. JEL0866]|nr:hypothetical protein HDV06_006356 [Boothiomyces sp. JEL0866]